MAVVKRLGMCVMRWRFAYIADDGAILGALGRYVKDGALSPVSMFSRRG